MKDNYFLTYLKESIGLKTSISDIPKQELLIKTDEKSIKDIDALYSHFKEFKKDDDEKLKKFKKFKKERASILKKYNLKIENGEIVSKNKPEQNQPLLFQDIEITKNPNEFNQEVKNRIIELNTEIEKNESAYRKNLRTILKRFFTVNRKISKRYIYLPVANSLNLSEIEKINNNNHLDMLLKIKNGFFVELKEEDEEVVEYLRKHGYKLTNHQYIKNICVNENDKEVPIDKELTNISIIDIDQKNKALQKQKDPKIIEKIKKEIIKSENFKNKYLQTIKKIKESIELLNKNVIILTWVPRLIFSQSTNTIWRSCMTYSFNPSEHGVNIRYVPQGVKNGVFIAWLVNIDDKYITKPIARALLKPYDTEKGENVFYWPSKIYTTGGQENIINMFRKTLTNYCTLKQKDIINIKQQDFYLKKDVYDDREEKIEFRSASEINDLFKRTYSDYEELYILLTKSTDVDKRILIKIINKSLRYSEFNRDYQLLVFAEVMKWAFKLKQNHLIKIAFDFLKKKAKIFLLKEILFDSRNLINYFNNNKTNFAYFISLYNRDLFKTNDVSNDVSSVIFNFLRLHNEKEFDIFDYVKIMFDHFGKNIYGYKYHEAKKLLQSDGKTSDIIAMIKELDLDLDLKDTNMFEVYKKNSKLFFKLLENNNKFIDFDHDDIIIFINNLLGQKEKNKIEVLKKFLSMTDFQMSEKIYDYSRVTVLIYEKIISEKDLFLLKNKLSEKNIILEKALPKEIIEKRKNSLESINKIIVGLLKQNTKEAFNFYKNIMATINGIPEVDFNFYKILINYLFANDVNVDLIIDFLKNLPKLEKITSFNKNDFFIYHKKIKDEKKKKELTILFTEKFVNLKNNNLIEEDPYLFFNLMAMQDDEIFDRFITKIDEIIMLNFFKKTSTNYNFDFKKEDSAQDFHKVVDFLVKNKKNINLADKKTVDKFFKEENENDRFTAESVINKFYIYKILLKNNLITSSNFFQIQTLMFEHLRYQLKMKELANFIFSLAFYKHISVEIYKDILSFKDNFYLTFVEPTHPFNFKYLINISAEQMREITENKNVKEFYNKLDEESKTGFISMLIKYQIDYNVDGFYEKMLDNFGLRSNFEKIINELIEKRKKYKTNYAEYGETYATQYPENIIFYGILANIKIFKNYIEKDKIIKFIDETDHPGSLDHMSNFLNKNDLKDDKIKKAIVQFLVTEFHLRNRYVACVNIFGKKEIDDLIEENENLRKLREEYEKRTRTF